LFQRPGWACAFVGTWRDGERTSRSTVHENDGRVGLVDAEAETFFQVKCDDLGVVPGVTNREILTDVEDEIVAGACVAGREGSAS